MTFTPPRLSSVFAALLVLAAPMIADAQGVDLTQLQAKLTALYPTAKATADGTDLVTAGAVLVLQKDHLVMNKVDEHMLTTNFYKNGAINQGGMGGFIKSMSMLSKFAPPGAAPPDGGQYQTREFVAGEKFFVTRISAAPDGVTFVFISDPIKDQRYKAMLRFAYPKGPATSIDDVEAQVAEVLKVDGGADQSAAQTAAAPAAAPADAPQTKKIALGESRDEVIATFGVPGKVVQLGANEIDYFTDMKVTFVKNKVTNVE